MVFLRLIAVLLVITLGAALVMYLFTRNRRYLDFARRVLQLGVVFLMVFLALYVLERFVLVV